MQTRQSSFIEACFNVLIGFWVNFFANLMILPAFGFNALTIELNLYIGAAYTLVSVVRSYAIRRWFNARIHRAALRLSKVRA